MSKQIKRHTPAGIFMHWFNAVCWFFLLLTGLGLIENAAVSPLGEWYPRMLRDIFGSGEALLQAHWGVGAFWIGVWLVFIVAGAKKYTIPFLKEMVSFKLPRDAVWMIKKNLQMLAGHKVMAKAVKPLGMDAKIPEAEYYNPGQKAAAIPIIGGAILLALTGIVMVLSNRAMVASQIWIVQWSITIHYVMAALTFAVLLVHIYMAGISKEERPAFVSMFTGYVPEEYAKHHHRLWYEEVKESN
jgi:formate dehydrogenase subunit gamma